MQYKNIVQGTFIERPNRFIAFVELMGKTEKVHVKNTGRCKEILQPGTVVFLEKSENPKRTTAYDLVAVVKENRIVNIDSQAPNKVVAEWLKTKAYFPDLVRVRPETTYGKSRFDFYIETESEKIFMEVKGVTLEQQNVVSFPDAPSERAVKHVEELVKAKREGYRAMCMFVIQMEGVSYFKPNWNAHPEFARALYSAYEAGVEILAYECVVDQNGFTVSKPVPVCLEEMSEGENRKGENRKRDRIRNGEQ